MYYNNNLKSYKKKRRKSVNNYVKPESIFTMWSTPIDTIKHFTHGDNNVNSNNKKKNDDKTGYDGTSTTTKKDRQLATPHAALVNSVFASGSHYSKCNILTPPRYRISPVYLIPKPLVTTKYIHSPGTFKDLFISNSASQLDSMIFMLCSTTHINSVSGKREFDFSGYTNNDYSFFAKSLMYHYQKIGLGFGATYYNVLTPSKAIRNMANGYYSASNQWSISNANRPYFSREQWYTPNAPAALQWDVSIFMYPRTHNYNENAGIRDLQTGTSTTIDLRTPIVFKKYYDDLSINATFIPYKSDTLWASMYSKPETYFRLANLINSQWHAQEYLVGYNNHQPIMFDIHKYDDSGTHKIRSSYNFDRVLVLPDDLGAQFINYINNGNVATRLKVTNAEAAGQLHFPTHLIILSRGHQSEHGSNHPRGAHDTIHDLHLIADYYIWNAATKLYVNHFSYMLNSGDDTNFRRQVYRSGV